MSSLGNRGFVYSQPATLGELAFMLWLVIKGAVPEGALAATAAAP